MKCCTEKSGNEKAVKTVKSIVQQQPKIQKAYEEYREKLEKIGVGRAELANRYTAQSQNSVESISAVFPIVTHSSILIMQGAMLGNTT